MGAADGTLAAWCTPPLTLVLTLALNVFRPNPNPNLGGVLGLLLAFRTNQAYLRYQQLCTTWVSLATHSLNMARNAAQLDFKLYSAVLRHVIAFPIAIKQVRK